VIGREVVRDAIQLEGGVADALATRPPRTQSRGSVALHGKGLTRSMKI